MQTSCSSSWTRLSDRPRFDALRTSVEAVLAAHGDEVAFIVLYGSMARGDFSLGSDFDLLIGLSGPTDERFLDRLTRFGLRLSGPVDALVYSGPEIERMFAERHLLLLEALSDGVVLHDTGVFAGLCTRFAEAVRNGSVRRARNGWDLAPGAR